MPINKPTTIYRKLLKDALSITWERKTLWVFGIFAALVSTGGVLDSALRSMRRVKSGGNLLDNLLDSSFILYELFGQYVSQLQVIGESKVTFMVVVLTVFCVGLFAAAIIAQGSLVHGIKSPTHKHPKLVRTHSLPHFWDIFVVDVLTKVLTTVLVIITTLPVFWYFVQTSTYSTWVVFIQLIIFIPVIIFINIISVLSIIHIVETNKNAYEGIQKALSIFKKQWVSAIEFSVILFLLVILASLVAVVALLLLSIPLGLLYSTSLFSSSAQVFFAVNTVIGLLIFAFLLAGLLWLFSTALGISFTNSQRTKFMDLSLSLKF